MNMTEWAEKEVEIACERERAGQDPSEWDYGVACYESALKAYKSLMEDGHSGMSISITKGILNKLIDEKPLTPIEDNPDVWYERCVFKDGVIESYQCNRMSSLFKDVYKDGTVKYTDIDRVLCFYNYNENIPWHNGMVREIIDEMFPITMPYYPSDPYKVYCTEFLTDEANGDYDTIGILYVKKGDGNERHDICRYFKDGPDGKMVEITPREYIERRLKAKKLEERKKESY